MSSATEAVKKHPAGTTAGVGGVVVGAIVAVLHVTPEQAGAIIAGLGLLTTGVSWVAAHGGIAGLWHDLIHGTTDEE